MKASVTASGISLRSRSESTFTLLLVSGSTRDELNMFMFTATVRCGDRIVSSGDNQKF